MPKIFAAVIVVALVSLCCTASGTNPPTKVKGSKQAVLQLKALEDLVDGIQSPGMRAYALTQLAQAYAVNNRAHAEKLLNDALSLVNTLQPGTSKTFLGELVSTRLALTAPGKLEQLISGASPQLRRAILQLLLAKYEREKQFDNAVDLLYRIADESEFPYAAADRILPHIPTAKRAEKQALFDFALRDYKRHRHDSFDSRNDFGLFVAHVWRGMDPRSVEDAILYLLHEAEDESEDPDGASRVSVTGAAGSASFASLYQFRLFQLLPVLRKVDSAKADELLEKYSATQELLGRYPQGVLSLSSDASGKGAGQHLIIGVSSGGASLQMESSSYRIELKKAQQSMEVSFVDFPRALSMVESLTHPSLRALALDGIARGLSGTHSSQAKRALQGLLDTAPKLSPQLRAKYLISAATTYFAMNDADDARSTLNAAGAAVKELYNRDSDKEDPNTSLKAFWPSSVMWQQVIVLANKISEGAAREIIKAIPDQEIALMATISLDGSKLGVPPLPIMTITTHKNGEITYRPDEP